jgi:ParB family transcriptional regulator, chromosome partitioning protein
MKLEHIELENLKISPVNVRKHGGKNVDDLVTSIRKLGILQPLLVRPNCEGFEVVAGQRRLKAAQIIADQDDGKIEPVPCAILEGGDDAKAIEASLSENVARVPMDEIDQYEAFAALIANGKTIADIADNFGVTELLVRKRLAIANLIKPVLNAYRKEEISADIIRALTLATKKQQKQWLDLFRDPEEYAPRGNQLKAWLFGGAEIPVSNALFDLADYKGAIKGDLFGDQQYFANTSKFWEYQNKALAAQREQYGNEGWRDVIVMDIGKRFCPYDMVKRHRDDCGKVYISCAANGEVEFHEGWLESSAAKRLDRVKADINGEENSVDVRERHELTKAAQTYMDLHRHAVVRTELLKQPALALRLMVAHAIADSGLWTVKPEPQNTGGNETIRDSLESAKAQKAFAKERSAVCELLGIEAGREHLCSHDYMSDYAALELSAIFTKLCDLSDKQVMRVLAFTMSETLVSGTELIDDLGASMGVDMRNWWKPDEAFYDLLRDKQMINVMLGEIGGEVVADGNVTATAKAQKQIIRDYAEGNGSRDKAEGWLPRFMRFPMQFYRQQVS